MKTGKTMDSLPERVKSQSHERFLESWDFSILYKSKQTLCTSVIPSETHKKSNIHITQLDLIHKMELQFAGD